jgi:hypothetical protein
MTNALLSCQCWVDFSPPEKPGHTVNCLRHGPATVLFDNVKLECDDCDHIRYYGNLAPMTVCAFATRHMLRHRHTTRHYRQFDRDGTMCVHIFTQAPVLTRGRPPF